ncbi:MAG: choice-of-anchor D domain-containing protein, partial [Phycisphaerae bacterium]|nr:choice-of-anchor D domain-containing protein [Phycisphaerae bacterium]
MEPRVLLSADLPGADPSLLGVARAEQVIVVDLHEGDAESGATATLPNLTPYQPSGWSDEIVVSTRTGTSTDNSPLSPTDALYVDWAVINNGSAATGATFSVGLYVDGGLRASWSVNLSLNPGYYVYASDYSIGTLSSGSHTIEIRSDRTGMIAEASEADNTYTRTITVGAASATGEIRGSAWNDLDDDGIWDGNEPGLSNWEVYLDLNASGAWNTGEPKTTTAGDGSYAFTNLLPGTYTVVEIVQDGWRQSYPVVSAGGYNIDLALTGFSTSQRAIFEQAAARWERIILGDLPDVSYQGAIIDDVQIIASAVTMDGPGGILGQAGPDLLRAGSLLPAHGIMQYDSADLAAMESSGALLGVIVHEMAHVLGFGILWDNLNLLTGTNTSDPRFTGTRAVAEYNRIFGLSGSSVPVEAGGGAGTRLSHWRESTFGTELMTGWYNSGRINPLSSVTVGSMGDLGYVVDMQAADPYTPSLSLMQMLLEPGTGGYILGLEYEPAIVESMDLLWGLSVQTPGTYTVVLSSGQQVAGKNFGNHSLTSASPAEIAVLGNGVSIADGDITPGTTDRTDFGTTMLGGAGITRTFTVRNDGGSTLTLGAVSVPTGFTLVEGLSGTLAAGSSDTFTIRLDTATGGIKTGDVVFTNNDSNESPFNFRIRGTVQAPPAEIAVLGNGISITDGDTTPSTGDGTDFGIAARGSASIDRTFTVRNEGGSTLTLGRVTVPYGFTLVEGLSTSLAAGASDTFTVRLNTTYVTTRSGQISVTSNDGNESPFNFTITGRILPPQVPEVEVRGNGRVILDGDLSASTLDHTDFGTAIQNQAGPTRTFTVYNTGTAALTLGAVSVPAGFSLVEGLSGTLAAGSSDTFTIRLDTATGGIKTG